MRKTAFKQTDHLEFLIRINNIKESWKESGSLELKRKILRNLTENEYPDSFYENYTKDNIKKELGEFILEILRVFD